MTATSAYSYFLRIAAACFTAWALTASEYHGTVATSGLPVPGVTVTATQAGKKVVTTTDERAVSRSRNLADGTWTLEVETLGFVKLTREVGRGAGGSAASILVEDSIRGGVDCRS